MKNIFLIGFLFLLTSCSNGYWVQEDLVIRGSITIPEFHHHRCDSLECKCFYVEEVTFDFVDTMVIEYYEPKIKRRKFGKLK
jgi:hypothetical protein